jgi:hypothetical protein
MTDFTDPAWVSIAHEWISGQLAQHGRRLAGLIEQPHIRPWSTVMRVPTNSGTTWFKANIPRLAYEARVVQLIAREQPLAGPELLGIDPERGWMLTADGGPRLRELVAREKDFGRWFDVLPVYAQLQRNMAPFVDELIAIGAPDRRLALLPGQYEELLDRNLGLSAEEMRHLHDLRPWVRDACAQLADSAVPETLQHDDLHDGQVFFRDGRYLIADWNDACVTHPFFSMSVTLEGQLGWGFEDVEGSVDIRPFRDGCRRPCGLAGYAAASTTRRPSGRRTLMPIRARPECACRCS